MKFIYLSILPLILFYDANAQTANIANCGIQADEPPGCLLCDSILIIDNDIYTGEFPGPAYECGYIENNFWVAFIADGNTFSVDDYSYNCEKGRGTESIVYNQNFEPVSFCFSTSNLPGDINVYNLEADQVYYFMVDGFMGDVCTDEYHFKSGIKFPILDTPRLRPNSIIPDTICPGEKVLLSFDSLSSFNEILLGTSKNQFIEPDEGGLNFSITFLEPGPDSIFYYSKTPCKNGSVISIPIFVNPGFIQKVIDSSFCRSYCFPFRDTVYCEYGTHIYSSPSPNGCDSTFIITLREGIQVVNNETINICEGDSIPWMGQVINEAGRYIEIKTDSLTGCDSIFELRVIVHPQRTDFFTINLMENDTFLGRIITIDTIIADTFQSIFGCDSIRRYSIKVEKSGLDSRNVGYPGLHLYPNPNNGNFILMWEKELTIEAQLSLYDSTGKLILKKGNIQVVAGENQQHLPPNLPPGLYQLLIKTNKGQGNYRIIIQP
ncbi:MAG: T9SS type A sorting domain-containing protein [Saprospiraceae bacterium]|nr:T9SS type A sorting domain-containing protein [Saprospiraceae bacterium]